MWFLLALGSAVFFAGQSAAAKRAGRRVHGDVVAFAGFALAIPVYALVLWGSGLPPIGAGFAGWLALSVGCNLFAMPMFFRALGKGELSVVLPLSTLTPLFALGTERLLLGVTPRAESAGGVVLLVLGAYLLHAGELREGVWAPIVALGRSAGARLAAATAVLWSITAVADRGAVLASSPSLYLLAFAVCFSVLLLPWLLWRRPDALRRFVRRPWSLAPVALLGAAMAICQMAAFALAPAALVVAVKRLAAVFGVVLGGAFFHERAWVRLGAATLMVAGAVVLALG